MSLKNKNNYYNNLEIMNLIYGEIYNIDFMPNVVIYV